MITAIIGSRGITDYAKIVEILSRHTITKIISGGAKGVDSLAEHYSDEHNIELVVFKPDWKKYGRGAGPVRNRTIVEAAEMIVAFWDGESRGTLDAINYAKKIGKPIEVWTIVNEIK